MKKIVAAIILLSLLFINSSFNKPQSSITGAWHWKEEDDEAVIICKDSYIVIAVFNQINTQFDYSSGGTYKEGKGQLIIKIDFTTRKKDLEKIGTEKGLIYSLSGDKLTVTLNDSTTKVLTRVDDGTGTMAGAWRITSRMSNGQMESIQKGPRKTLKILSGTRFQWIAFNTETKEFFGSGGGRYSFKDGKYTENIEFFSRDPNRIGTSLTFDGTVNKNIWTHKGINSRGEPLHEEWTRE